MKRILVVLTVALVMAVMLVVMAAPALAVIVPMQACQGAINAVNASPWAPERYGGDTGPCVTSRFGPHPGKSPEAFGMRCTTATDRAGAGNTPSPALFMLLISLTGHSNTLGLRWCAVGVCLAIVSRLQPLGAALIDLP